MAGKALTTMFVFSRLSRAVPPPEPPEEHPAASIVTATADATSIVRGFILAPSGIADPAIRDRLGGTAIGSGDYCVTMIIMFCTVRHMPNGTTYPNLASFCYQY